MSLLQGTPNVDLLSVVVVVVVVVDVDVDDDDLLPKDEWKLL
jgi:hypothetical protein